jgi:hypothetical protein
MVAELLYGTLHFTQADKENFGSRDTLNQPIEVLIDKWKVTTHIASSFCCTYSFG